MFKEKIQKELAKIGIVVNGTNSWDIQVHDERLYRRVILRGSIGLGEAYVDGWWDCQKLDEFFFRILRARLQNKFKAPGQDFFHGLVNIFNRQTIDRALEVGEKHYDLGNDLYKLMLDKRMVYTCGYWKDAKNLDEAQEAKMDLICRKLNLKAGDKVLDIGCGFGSFAKFASEKYDARVTGITISKEQLALGKEMCKGLPVDLKFLDYRNTEGMYDHIVSIGMFEAVGHKNYREFMEIVGRHLKDDGIFLLHTIGEDFSSIDVDPWIEKYIFPNGILPTVSKVGSAIKDIFVVEDLHNFGQYYDLTLMVWCKNFENNWPKLKDKYGESFHRMWKYYLLSCAGAFRAREMPLWQIVLTKGGKIGGYKSIR
ncbi:MAG: cyclopropane fatty acyl phospholipid synthase [bacterium]|nr:cyclopropane fatty acyl phospholipid synthase [bacterium]